MGWLTEATLLLSFFCFIFAFYSNMRRVGGPLGPRIPRGPILPAFPENTEPKTSSSSGSTAPEEDGAFYPSMEDVLQVRAILRRAGPREATGLPNEVVDMIVDDAEYWPSVATKLESTPFGIGADGDRECMRTRPLCYDVGEQEDESPDNPPKVLLHRGKAPCRKIVFDISSHDQGWGGERAHKGTYQGSWTWFDAYIMHSENLPDPTPQQPSRRPSRSLIRPVQDPGTMRNGRGGEEEEDGEGERDQSAATENRSESSHPRPFLPSLKKLQSNRTATKETTDFHIVWHYRDSIPPESEEAERIEREEGRGRETLDGRAVREMQIGDQVVVWLRARFPGWRNHVEKMSVRVFWAA